MRQIAKRSHHATTSRPVSFFSRAFFLPSFLPSSSFLLLIFYPDRLPCLAYNQCRAMKLFRCLLTQSNARLCHPDDFEKTEFMMLGVHAIVSGFAMPIGFNIEPIILSTVLQAANNFHLHENNHLLGGNLRNWNLYNYIAIMRLLLPLCARGLSYHKMLHRISYLEYTFQLRNTITLYRNKNFPVSHKQSFSEVYLFFHALRENFPDNTISKRLSVYLSPAFYLSSSFFALTHFILEIIIMSQKNTILFQRNTDIYLSMIGNIINIIICDRYHHCNYFHYRHSDLKSFILYNLIWICFSCEYRLSIILFLLFLFVKT